MTAPLNQCPACDYDLRGLPAAHRCPECGFEYDERTRAWRLARPPSLRQRAVSEVLAPIGIILVFWLFKGGKTPLAQVLAFLGILAALWFAWRGLEYALRGATRPCLTIAPAGVYARTSAKAGGRLVPWKEFLSADGRPDKKTVLRQLNVLIAQTGGTGAIFENLAEEQAFQEGVYEAVERAADR